MAYEAATVHNVRIVDQILTMKDLQYVQNTLWEIRIHYRNLGIELGLSLSDITAIEWNNRYQVDECFRDVLESILKNGVRREKLIGALQSVTVEVTTAAKYLIINKLADEHPSLDQWQVNEILKASHVPTYDGECIIERKEKLKEIREALMTLRGKNDVWVVLYGKSGYGKTVLAAEAVRDEKFIREIFPGGIHWLTVGKLKDSKGRINQEKLHDKLQTIITRLDKNKRKRHVKTVEAATEYLLKIIAEQYPRSLLILDDVQSTEVARAFNVYCPILITSRNAMVVNEFTKSKCVSVAEGLNEEESRDLLALKLSCKRDELPTQADMIIEYCRGSPRAISKVGDYLVEDPTDDALWNEISDDLRDGHLQKVFELDDSSLDG